MNLHVILERLPLARLARSEISRTVSPVRPSLLLFSLQSFLSARLTAALLVFVLIFAFALGFRFAAIGRAVASRGILDLF